MDPIYDNIAANKRWTYIFFALYAVLIGIIGYLIGYYLGFPILGLLMGLLVFALIIVLTYYKGQNMITTMADAQEVSLEEEPYLYNTVDALRIGAGLPMPKLYVIDTEIPNAFAAGRNPKNASITVTRGLLDSLDRLELEGVIAHEMSHIKNYDVLLATVAVILAGTIVFLGFAARYSAYGGIFRGGSRAGPAGIIIIILFILLIFLAPLFARLLKFAISRKREYLADATGAELTGYPEGLASALEKISGLQKPKSKIANKALTGLYIINPAVGEDTGNSLFDTHPPTEERIRRLREMEFIDQKPLKSTSMDQNQANEETTPVNTKYINDASPDSMKLLGTNQVITEQSGYGYLVCDKCNGYYKLQKGESPENFSNRCECGGKLEYRDKLNSLNINTP